LAEQTIVWVSHIRQLVKTPIYILKTLLSIAAYFSLCHKLKLSHSTLRNILVRKIFFYRKFKWQITFTNTDGQTETTVY